MFKITRFFNLIFIALWISSCYPSDFMVTPSPIPEPTLYSDNIATSTNDPITQANILRHTQEALQPYIDSTSTARADIELQATLEAAETMDSLSIQLTLEYVDGQKTVDAYRFQQTQAVNTAEAYKATEANTYNLISTQGAAIKTQTVEAGILRREEREREKKEREDNIAMFVAPIQAAFWLVLPLVIVTLILIAIVALTRKMIPVIEARSRYVKNGSQMLYTSGSGDIVNISNVPAATPFGPSLVITPHGSTVGGFSTAEQQALINFQQFAVQLARNFPNTHAGRSDLEELLQRLYTGRSNIPDGQVKEVGFPMLSSGGNLPEQAPWELIRNYRGNGLPVGILEDGSLLDPDIETIAHRLFAGASGSGKSRQGTRPTVATALAKGFYVISLDIRQSPDLKIFEGHKNFRSIVTPNKAMESIIYYLEAIDAEVSHRWDALYKNDATTWSRMPGDHLPRILVVVDEYPSIIDELHLRYPLAAKAMQILVSNISRLARKAGIHVLLGAQNPTKDSVLPSIRRNMLSVVFRTTDQRASLAIAGVSGADKLMGKQFLANDQTGKISRGVAFAPSDNEIIDVIGRDVPHHETPTWVDNPPSSSAVLSTMQQRNRLPDKSQVVQDRNTQIIELWKAQKATGNVSLSKIENAIFGHTAGRAYRIVRRVIDDYEQSLEPDEKEKVSDVIE